MALAKRKGFTIVELVVVIAVIAILAGVLMPVFNTIVLNSKRSSALSDAKNALTALNAEYIAAHEGCPLPNGVVFESGGFCFVFLGGALHEIVFAEEITLGGAAVNLWLSPGVSPDDAAVSLALSAYREAGGPPAAVPVDGQERPCLDVGFVECEDGGGVFAFLKANDAPLYRANECGAYFGTMLSGTAPKTGEVPGDGSGSGTAGSDAPSPIYAVTVNVPETCGFDGGSSVDAHGGYTLTFIPGEHYVLKNRPEIRIDGGVFDNFAWDEETLTLVIPPEAITGDIAVTAETEGKSYALNVAAAGCAPAAPPETARHGENLVLRFSPENAHTLAGSAPGVMSGGVFLEDGAFAWDETTGELTVYGDRITGDISVTVNAPKLCLFSYSAYDVTVCDKDGKEILCLDHDGAPVEYYINAGEDFTFTIAHSSSYTIDGENSYIENGGIYWFFNAGSDRNISITDISSEGAVITIHGDFINGDIYMQIFSG